MKLVNAITGVVLHTRVYFDKLKTATAKLRVFGVEDFNPTLVYEPFVGLLQNHLK